jgi:hypothetical protein
MTSPVYRLIQALAQLPPDEEIAGQYIQSKHLKCAIFGNDIPPEVWALFIAWLDDTNWADKVSLLTAQYYEDLKEENKVNDNFVDAVIKAGIDDEASLKHGKDFTASVTKAGRVKLKFAEEI